MIIFWQCTFRRVDEKSISRCIISYQISGATNRFLAHATISQLNFCLHLLSIDLLYFQNASQMHKIWKWLYSSVIIQMRNQKQSKASKARSATKSKFFLRGLVIQMFCLRMNTVLQNQLFKRKNFTKK